MVSTTRCALRCQAVQHVDRYVVSWLYLCWSVFVIFCLFISVYKIIYCIACHFACTTSAYIWHHTDVWCSIMRNVTAYLIDHKIHRLFRCNFTTALHCKNIGILLIAMLFAMFSMAILIDVDCSY